LDFSKYFCIYFLLKIMKLKNFWLFSSLALMSLMLVWCKTNAPELSFEETLKVYSEQTSIVKDALNFMNDTWSQIENELNVETNYDVWDSIKWTFTVKTDIVNDAKTKDTEWKISLWLTSNENIQDWFYIKSAKVDLNTLVKDFKLYFKLLDFSIDSNQPEYVAMITEIVNGFKNKWLTINSEEYSNLLKMSSESSFDMYSYLETKDNDKIFAEKELTKFDWYPAWKVSFNEEEIKKLAKEVYEQEQKESEKFSSWVNSEQNLSDEELDKVFDDLKIENSEAYFVIRSSDKVDFILKNIDIITAWEKINITDTINKKTIWKDGETIKITISDVEKESSIVLISIDLNPGLTSYGINLKAEAKNGEEIQELFNLEWDITASLSEKTLKLNPNLKITSDSFIADMKVDFVSNKIENYKFETPEDAQDINEIIESLLWGEENIDNEDYVYDYDEDFIQEEENLVQEEDLSGDIKVDEESQTGEIIEE